MGGNYPDEVKCSIAREARRRGLNIQTPPGPGIHDQENFYALHEIPCVSWTSATAQHGPATECRRAIVQARWATTRIHPISPLAPSCPTSNLTSRRSTFLKSTTQ